MVIPKASGEDVTEFRVRPIYLLNVVAVKILEDLIAKKGN